MLDKNLFLYNLAITAIFKDEARYLKEWLDYHLLAGVEHFYLYNNDSSDEYKEVLAPYIEKNLVTLTNFPGKSMQHPACNDAIEKHRFDCRYMAFIDLDEFIFPKSKVGGGILEVVDEVLSSNPNAVALAINWQIFGSNGHEKADYSRGVLERFTRHALPNDPHFLDANGNRSGDAHVKVIANPRFIQCVNNPHYAVYFEGKITVNSNGEVLQTFYNDPALYDKIVVNHYCIKSREEFLLKRSRGRAAVYREIYKEYFSANDRNEVFDDEILKYREARAENFSFESDEHRINRVINSLTKILMQVSPEEIDMETFLTCRAVAEKFQLKIGDRSAEEYALAWIYRALNTDNILTYADLQLFIEALPEIIARPFPLVKDICQTSASRILPALMEAEKNRGLIGNHKNLRHLQRMLDAIK